ncbi:MAG: restriction endonuclease subunit S [Peptococcaceae bacterium]|nr:MAG: restriction endonuclease subunit S [Peptococcaceae bacterium]
MTEAADLLSTISQADAKKWRQYPAYKDSGIEWLGEIPEHWEVKQLKRGYDVQLGKILRNESVSKQDTLEPYIRAANVYWEGIDISDIKEMWFSPGEKKQYEVSKGDLIVCEGGDVGRSAIWDGSITPIYIQNAVHRVRAKDSNLNKFLYYLMYALKSCGYFDLLCDRATLAHLTREKLVRILLPFPPLSEQEIIAAFLDRETAKIDALVATKERFIELLAEKRTALISQAVTKGLDPNAPMKDFGVEWLGEIAAHWEVKRLKHAVSSLIVKGNSVKRPFVALEYIMSGFAKLVNDYEYPIADASEYALFEEGDILFGKLRPYLRKYWLANFSGCCPAELLVLRPDEEQLDRKFFYYFIQSAYFIAMADGTSYGVKMPRTSWEKLGWMSIVFPDIYKQRTIASHLDAETAKIDALIAKTRESIEKLKEYRTALISAAVTGKINVREEAP